LIAAALASGACLAGASGRRVAAVLAAGQLLGLAFQGADDLLDVCGEASQLGKSVGKDRACGKATWVRLEGEARARARTARYGERGVAALRRALPAGAARERLIELARRLWERDR
jgi:geranylgeranyl pyrophosphate synthase